jgi:hypothetical protein
MEPASMLTARTVLSLFFIGSSDPDTRFGQFAVLSKESSMKRARGQLTNVKLLSQQHFYLLPRRNIFPTIRSGLNL